MSIMSEEEKKAIDNMKSLLLYSKEHEYFSPFMEQEIVDMNIVLNIIEKQQKEIEKEKNRIMELAELLDKQENEIKFLKGELEIQEGCYISKDKIREKIKKCNDYLKEEPMNIEKIEINAKISILQELLEEK